jgi:large subunit ribosomal protein L13
VKTHFPRKEDYRARKWFLVDADGQTLGRLSTKVANLLHGKDNPEFTPHLDTGAHVVVINAGKVHLTGKKLDQKLYYRHTGYPGGLKQTTAGALREKYPERLIQHAVRGMLPKNKLGRAILKKLKVYRGGEHPHVAQNPQQIDLHKH